MFRKYHYLSDDFNKAARVWVVFANGALAAFVSVLPQPCPVKNLFRFHRVVVFPDYQGVGIGTKSMEIVAQIYKDDGKKISILSSNIALILGLQKNPKFICSRYGRIQKKSVKARANDIAGLFSNNMSEKRRTATFEYIGAR